MRISRVLNLYFFSYFCESNFNIKLSENDHNYALSICFRKTFIENKQIYYEIVDSDSAALTTSLNVERYLRNITRRKKPTRKKRPGPKVQTDKEEKVKEETAKEATFKLPESDSNDEDEYYDEYYDVYYDEY